LFAARPDFRDVIMALARGVSRREAPKLAPDTLSIPMSRAMIDAFVP
jgi:hypothetical protein